MHRTGTTAGGGVNTEGPVGLASRKIEPPNLTAG
jgi:hypothetical protein